MHKVGQMGQVTYKGNDAKSKTKISYAYTEIQTQVVVICNPTYYQLDHRGNQDNNCMLYPHSNTIQVYNNQQFIVHPVINYWSCPQSDQEFSFCCC